MHRSTVLFHVMNIWYGSLAFDDMEPNKVRTDRDVAVSHTDYWSHSSVKP